MANLYVQETVISERDNGDRVLIGESPVCESWTDSRGELFRAMQREEGRCISRVYRDVPDGTPQAIGWVFQARRPMDHGHGESTLIETWVTVHTAPPTVTTEYHYAPSGDE